VDGAEVGGSSDEGFVWDNAGTGFVLEIDV
jgi:hypothetical protein